MPHPPCTSSEPLESECDSAVGLTKGGLYHHVDKKEDLLFLIHDEMADAFLERLEKSVSQQNDPMEKLKAWIKVHLKLMEDFGPNVKIFFDELKNLEKTHQWRK